MDFQRFSIGFLHILCLYSFITILHLIVPSHLVRGYASDGPKFYRLNGLRVFLLTILLFLLLLQWIDASYFLQYRVDHGIAACLLGLIFTLIFVLPHKKVHSSFWMDLYLGRLKNPQCFSDRADAKMLLYLIGGIALELNLIILFYQHRTNESMSNVSLYVFLFSFFLIEYFYHEHVHLYTFDFLVEYLGFKLIWGCLVFYPFFYPIAIWSSVTPHRLSLFRWISSISIFFLGWILSRGANNQKYLFRTQPEEKFLGLIRPISINGRLLCSGWWKLSRHINYLGDTFMAVGLSLAIDAGWIPWLYPFYYVLLFFARERTDFQRCEEKYGKDWKEYCRRVPYRIIPGIY